MSLNTLFNQRISVESFLGSDSYGAPQFGPAVTYWGRVSLQNRSIKEASGNEVVSNMIVYLDTNRSITLKDRVTLPAGYEPQQPPIQRIYRAQNGKGPHHIELYC